MSDKVETAELREKAFTIVEFGKPSLAVRLEDAEAAIEEARTQFASYHQTSASPDPLEEHPILAFNKWLLGHVEIHGKLTQKEYGIAYSAFIAAHPGQGPTSSVMSGQTETAAGIAERLLPCRDEQGVFCSYDGSRHSAECFARFRPEVTAAIEAAERRGAEQVLTAVERWAEDRDEPEVAYCARRVREARAHSKT